MSNACSSDGVRWNFFRRLADTRHYCFISHAPAIDISRVWPTSCDVFRLCVAGWYLQDLFETMSLTLATAVILGSKIHKAFCDIQQEMQKHDVYVDGAVVVVVVVVIIDIDYYVCENLIIFCAASIIVYIVLYLYFNGLLLFLF